MLGQDFRFSADGAESATDDTEQALDLIVASAAHRREGGAGLPRFLKQLSTPQLEALVLFVPAEPGRWLTRLEALGQRLRGARVITAVDEAPDPVVTGLSRSARHLLFAPTSDRQRVARQLGRVLAPLGRIGCTLHVIHRPTGELLGAGQIEALAGTGARR